MPLIKVCGASSKKNPSTQSHLEQYSPKAFGIKNHKTIESINKSDPVINKVQQSHCSMRSCMSTELEQSLPHSHNLTPGRHDWGRRMMLVKPSPHFWHFRQSVCKLRGDCWTQHDPRHLASWWWSQPRWELSTDISSFLILIWKREINLQIWNWCWIWPYKKCFNENPSEITGL